MGDSMIPKKIHYCWFGRNPLPDSARKCIASWKKYFPDYEVIEWNEDNYDVTALPYIREAYENKKYAFVSDYARFDILYRHGGLYFDTDVEVVRSFDDILAGGAFMGCESDDPITVNAGLGLGAPAGLPFYRTVLDFYQTQHFVFQDGTLNTETVVTKVTKLLLECGLCSAPGIQTVEGITVYPRDYFNPLNSNTGVLNKTANTHSIHWYSMTWLSPAMRLRTRLTRPLHRLLGEDFFHRGKK